MNGIAIFFALMSMVFASLFVADLKGYFNVAQRPVAFIKDASGTVRRLAKDQLTWDRAQGGTLFGAGDTVSTGEGANAKLVFYAGGELDLDSGAMVVLGGDLEDLKLNFVSGTGKIRVAKSAQKKISVTRGVKVASAKPAVKKQTTKPLPGETPSTVSDATEPVAGVKSKGGSKKNGAEPDYVPPPLDETSGDDSRIAVDVVDDKEVAPIAPPPTKDWEKEERERERARKAADEARIAEIARKEEEKRVAAKKKLDEERRIEQAKRAEEQRKIDEARREEERKVAESKKAEEEKKAAGLAKVEEEKKAEEAKRKAEDAMKLAIAAKTAESQRLAEEAKKAAEEAKQKAELARLEEEKKKEEARVAAEKVKAEQDKKAAELARIEAEKKAEEEKKLAEKKKIEDERRAVEIAKIQEERKAEDAKQAAVRATEKSGKAGRGESRSTASTSGSGLVPAIQEKNIRNPQKALTTQGGVLTAATLKLPPAPEVRWPEADAVINLAEMKSPKLEWELPEPGDPNDPKTSFEKAVGYEVTFRPLQGEGETKVLKTDKSLLALSQISRGKYLWSVRAVTASGKRGPGSSPRGLEIKIPEKLLKPTILPVKVE